MKNLSIVSFVIGFFALLVGVILMRLGFRLSGYPLPTEIGREYWAGMIAGMIGMIAARKVWP